MYQGATNHAHNVQLYVRKFVAHAKFLEAVQSFVSFVYFDHTLFIG